MIVLLLLPIINVILYIIIIMHNAYTVEDIPDGLNP